jgi:hypothetical protein
LLANPFIWVPLIAPVVLELLIRQTKWKFAGSKCFLECLARGPFMPAPWPEVVRVSAGNPHVWIYRVKTVREAQRS